MRSGFLTRSDSRPIDDSSPEEYRPMLGLLRHLIDVIERHGDGGELSHEDGHQLDRWEDDAYVYLGSAMPDIPDRDIDISVHDGNIMIRVER
jgi:HSP20 family molecular chaperone IbpA